MPLETLYTGMNDIPLETLYAGMIDILLETLNTDIPVWTKFRWKPYILVHRYVWYAIENLIY